MTPTSVSPLGGGVTPRQAYALHVASREEMRWRSYGGAARLGTTWLPFVHFRDAKSINRGMNTEVVWLGPESP